MKRFIGKKIVPSDLESFINGAIDNSIEYFIPKKVVGTRTKKVDMRRFEGYTLYKNGTVSTDRYFFLTNGNRTWKLYIPPTTTFILED